LAEVATGAVDPEAVRGAVHVVLAGMGIAAAVSKLNS
jgi:hypothetical protein